MSIETNSKILASDITAIKATADAALPKTGGTLTGNLTFSKNADTVLYKSTLNNRFIIRGGNSSFEDGASLYLYGKEHSEYPGEANIYAHDGTNNANLRLTPAGKAYIKSDEVITSAGGTLTGNITFNRDIIQIAHSSGKNSGYVMINGGDAYGTGASFVAYGKDHSSQPGVAYIRLTKTDPNDSTKTISKQLTLYPDGTLSWNNGYIISENSAGRITFKNGTQFWIE